MVKAYSTNYNYRKSLMLIGYGADQIHIDDNEDGSDVPHDHMILEVDITEPGYLYTYISNENSKVVDVYFPAQLARKLLPCQVQVY